MVKMNKKGILFTLGLTFLALVVLSLAVLIFHNTQEAEGIIAKLAVLDRVYDLDTSIQRSLGDIFALRSGISINITNTSVSFEEILQNNNQGTFNTTLHNFKGFIESNSFNINLTITNMAEMPLTIMPNNIAYKHKDNWSNIEVLPTSVNFNGYSVFIEIDKNVSCISCTWTFVAGSFNLSLEVCDVNNCAYTSQMIDPSANNEVRVDKLEDSSNLILIKVNNNGRLSINLTQDISVRARTTVLVNQPANVMADSLSLILNFGEFGVYKQSNVKII